MDKRRLGELDDEQALQALLREFGLADDEPEEVEDDEPRPIRERAPLPEGVTVREAEVGDVGEIIALLRELAERSGETCPANPAWTEEFLAFPGCGALLALRDRRVVGLCSYSVRPNLYHAADACHLEELVVASHARNQGIGGALLAEMVELAQALGCAEMSLAVEIDNEDALRFYARYGLSERTLLLERHF